MKNRDAKDLEEAKQRVARALVYAIAMHKFVRPPDLKFQTLDWQLAEVKRFNSRCAPEK